MGDLFDIANLITTVGVDAVKIKPEPGLPQKSSNEILTELFSTFNVPHGADDEEDDEEDSESGRSNIDSKKKDDETKKNHSTTELVDVNIKVEKIGEKAEASLVTKKKKVKKKSKHKNESKDKEKKHKHKKKSKHNSSESASDHENGGSKRKKKRKKSKRKHDSDLGKNSDNDEPSIKNRKLSKLNKEKSKDDIQSNEKSKSDVSEAILIKKEKKDESEFLKKTARSPVLLSLPIPKRLDDDPEALEVPKLIEKIKNPVPCKILIKDLKNSEVYNNTVKEVENKKKEKAERMEDGEISDSDEDEAIEADTNRTPTLSPTPPRDRSSGGGLRSDRNKYSTSPSSSKHVTKKNDLRHVLKEKEKKKYTRNSKSRSKNDRKDNKGNHHKSKDRGNTRSHSCHSRDRKTRSRSGDRGRRGRGRSRERRDSRRDGVSDKDRHSKDGNDRYKSRSEDRNRNKWRGRSRSRERKERIEIDKKKLLEIARRNAINMIMKGKLPLAQQDKAIAAIQAGGKTIDELTDFCKSLSKSEAMGELSSISSGDDSSSEKGFHHPFLIKERPSSIIMNIRDAKQLPTKTLLEKTTEATNQLRLQFPVSSGQQHRKTESEWIPVTPKPNKNPKPEAKKLFIPAKEVFHTIQQPVVVPPLQSIQPVAQIIPPVPTEIPIVQSVPMVQAVQQQSIFPPVPNEHVDISTIVSQRLAAMRKLSENPNDVQALNEMYKAQTGMKSWIESKQVPGQFTGSTGAKVLSPAELNSGQQAWARKIPH